jgi:hypothetical protein
MGWNASSTARVVAAMKRSLGVDGNGRQASPEEKMCFVINSKTREWAENQV